MSIDTFQLEDRANRADDFQLFAMFCAAQDRDEEEFFATLLEDRQIAWGWSKEENDYVITHMGISDDDGELIPYIANH